MSTIFLGAAFIKQAYAFMIQEVQYAKTNWLGTLYSMFMLLGSLIPSVRNFRRVLVNLFYRLIEHRKVPAHKRFG